MASDVVPAVVVSFGLTPDERLVAEEAVFRKSPTFPAGVRFVDGSAAAGDSTTIRQVWGVYHSGSWGRLGEVTRPLLLFCLCCRACVT